MALNSQRLAFIAKYKNDVIQETLGTGIFPSVKMAQMIVESADRNGEAGKGVTFIKANNAFGIKDSKAWKGKTMSFSTPKDGQPVNLFRVYPTIKDSIADHSKFLTDNKRYAKALTAKSPEQQLIEIEKAGYAEAAGYASKMAVIIKNYNLEALDKESAEFDTSANLKKKALKVALPLIAIGLIYLFK